MSLTRQLLIIIPIALIMMGGAMFGSVAYYPGNPPMQEATGAYKVNYGLMTSPPFFYKYYLYKPAHYSPGEKHPLVVLLHGVSRHMHGGRYILADDIIGRHPAFVLVPIAPEGMRWLEPGMDPAQSAAPLVRDAIARVTSAYTIDAKRIYISGYSMGGVGTYGMLKLYPDLFAAALVLCGAWDPAEARLLPANVPIIALHGSLDNPALGRAMIDALRQTGHSALFKEYRNVGHNVWDYAYPDARIWDWLFAQHR